MCVYINLGEYTTDTFISTWAWANCYLLTSNERHQREEGIWFYPVYQLPLRKRRIVNWCPCGGWSLWQWAAPLTTPSVVEKLSLSFRFRCAKICLAISVCVDFVQRVFRMKKDGGLDIQRERERCDMIWNEVGCSFVGRYRQQLVFIKYKQVHFNSYLPCLILYMRQCFYIKRKKLLLSFIILI